MSLFGFGSSSTTPTPAFGAAPAPAGQSTTTTTFGGFGSTTPAAAAPSSGPGTSFGSSFGTTPTTTTPAFGTTGNAPASNIFGSTAATTTPPTTTTSIFGGGTTPAPAAPSLFGAAPTASTFGAPTQPTAPAIIIRAGTPYASLPPEIKRAIDTTHQALMRHKKTMAVVETMAPALLRDPVIKPADAAAGSTDNANLPKQLQELRHTLEGLQGTIHKCREKALSLKGQMETSVTQSVAYGKWPIEAVAIRRGVKLPSTVTTTDPSVREQLDTLLHQQVVHVDRVEEMPSPYMWQTLEDLERRVGTLTQQVSTLNRELDANASDEVMDVAFIVHTQTEAIRRVAVDVMTVHEHMEELRTKYRQTEKGENILDKAEIEEFMRQSQLEQQSKQQYMKAAGSAAPQAPATAPAPGGLFSSASTSAPATSGGGGLFSSTSAAAGGNLFGSSTTPGPAPTPGASTSAAAGGNLFGSSTTPGPAPMPGGFAGFGGNAAPATATAATATATTGPTTSGLGGGNSTPGPAPAAIFGNASAAPTGTTPTTASQPGATFNFGGTPAPGAATGAASATPSFNLAGTPASTATASTPKKSGNKTRGRGGRYG